jgi:hypothetical protein
LAGNIGVVVSGQAKGMMEDLDWDWFDAVRRCVSLPIGAELPLQAEVNGAEGILADIPGPQAGKNLADQAEGVFHCASSGGPAAGGNAAISVSLGKDLEDRDRVSKVLEAGVDAQGGGKIHPGGPMVVGGRGTARNDAGSDRVLYKADVNAEFIGGRRWQSSHKEGCG